MVQYNSIDKAYNNLIPFVLKALIKVRAYNY
ncbi:Uncharacterised protein [Myroides odoratus]|nr:Uncharacterised protein [Myroides odoratus]